MEDKHGCRVKEDTTEDGSTIWEDKQVYNGTSRIDKGYATLQYKCALLEKKIEEKNKLIRTYHAKLLEMVYIATDILMLTGEE